MSQVDKLLAVRNWLDTRKNWILILDNADNLQMYQWIPKPSEKKKPKKHLDYLEFIPKGGPYETVLWTTRDGAIQNLLNDGCCVKIPVMTSSEGWKLFCQESGRNETSGPTSKDVRLLEDMLGLLPLSIRLAGAHIKTRRMTTEKYISVYGKKHERVLGVAIRGMYRHPQGTNSVMHTWQISMDVVAKESKCAATIMNTICFYDHRSIPSTLLEEAGSQFEETDIYRSEERRVGKECPV